MKTFQSIAESGPVVEVPARASEIPVPTIESPFGVPEIIPSLLLKIFQSIEDRKPLVDMFAWLIPITPVVLLYVIGHEAESAERALASVK